MNRMLPVVLALVIGLAAGAAEAAAPAPAATAPAAVPTGSILPGGEIQGPFGIGGCNARTRDRNFPSWIPQMAAIGIHTARGLGGCGWSGEAVRKWDTLDWQLEYLTGQGVSPGGGFYNFRNGPGKTGLPMDDLAGWSADVERLVTHFKGKIKYWEVWNEPPNGLAKGQTPADYAKYIVATYDAAKRANPGCLIGLAAKSAAINYLDQTIAAGAKGHFDYITLHPYETAGCVVDHPGTEMVYLQIAATTRKMLAARDPAKVNCPIIYTELGYAAGGQYNRGGPNTQAYAVVKYYTMAIATGIACLQWFEGRDGDSGPMGLIDDKGTPRPSYKALGEMIKYFGQHPQYLGWVMLNDKHYAFVFQGANGPVMATWASSRETDKVDFGQSVKIIDPLTANVTEAATYDLTVAPIFLDGVPAKLLATAKANKVKPFPWGGDYSQAKSVSVTFGEKTIEKGLHTKASASIAASVIAYGGNARAGSGVEGGNVFMVDPNFLSYTSTPIEIAIVCRRNEQNDPARVGFQYESTKDYKKAPAQDIPDNKNWHTLKWRIDDSQFVSMWAYSFIMDNGKYYVQSVTVTKLDR